MPGYDSIGSLGTASNPFSVTTVGGTSANNIAVEGNSASGATDTGNPVKVGGRYNAAAPTFTNGQRGDLQISADGRLRVSLFGNGFDTIVGAPSGDGLGGQPGAYIVAQNLLFEPISNTWFRARGDSAGSDVVFSPRPTAGGVTQFRRLATADTNAAVVKATPGRVYGYVIANTSASVKFVKLYNKATAPTVGTDTPLRTIMVPAGGIAAYHVGTGLGGFTAGIAVAATGAIADTDTTALAANDLIIAIDYA